MKEILYLYSAFDTLTKKSLQFEHRSKADLYAIVSATGLIMEPLFNWEPLYIFYNAIDEIQSCKIPMRNNNCVNGRRLIKADCTVNSRGVVQ